MIRKKNYSKIISILNGENNWFEWGAPRNIDKIKNNIGKNCVYIYNLTRHDNVAFLGKVRRVFINPNT